MLRKISAASLVLLIVLPFTAPWSTCDLASLLGHPSEQHDAGVLLIYHLATMVSRAPVRRDPDSPDAVVAITNAPAVPASMKTRRNLAISISTRATAIVRVTLHTQQTNPSPPPLSDTSERPLVLRL